jgi:hypothetical protein
MVSMMIRLLPLMSFFEGRNDMVVDVLDILDELIKSEERKWKKKN